MSTEILSTYRVQLHPGFGFDQAADVCAYLSALGASHLYASPYLQAAPGSAHGYDVVAHDRVNAELGGEAAHQRFCQALGRCGLGQILDIVPNHMAITRENAWWWDVLENGPASPYASYFEVDWDPPEAKQRNTVLVPVLGDHYGRVLENHELTISRSGGVFRLHYYDHTLPIAPRALAGLIGRAAERCGGVDLAYIAEALENLPAPMVTDRKSQRTRARHKEVLRGWLERLEAADPAVREALDAEVAAINGDPDRLDAVLDQQNYRIAYWRTAGRELDYRRFFDINTLVGLRQEDAQVFADTHALVLQWMWQGVLDGLRIDHPDGLRDPEDYFIRLRDAAGPGTWIVAEKILEPGEALRETWPIDGTTGYDFLNRAGGLFVDPKGEAPLSRSYAELTGETADYDQIVHRNKLRILEEILAADLTRVTLLLVQVCERHRRYRDYTRHDLRHVLRALIARMPVYRTYVREQEGPPRPDDVRHLESATTRAKEDRPDLDPDLFDFVRDVLLGRVTGTLETEVAMRTQQLTGPVMAKAVEDTTFYVYNRLVSLNEVGGDPNGFGVTPERFHLENEQIQTWWPRTMLTLSTHDTKRSADVRARLHLLSEIPDLWDAAVRRWMGINDRHRVDGRPDHNAEYLLYQVLVGAWPIGADRAVAYMEKASREAKQHTSWIDPDAAYDEALAGFVRAVLDDGAFVADLEAFVSPLVEPGRTNSLSQVLLELTCPGIPDVYQGDELWNLSLVDPDNRRPVDFEVRARLLAELPALTVEEIRRRSDEGLPKLFLIHRALTLRRAHPEWFGAEATYRPLQAEGSRKNHVVAFSRADAVVAVVPRLMHRLAGRWGRTSLTLPEGRWYDALAGREYTGGPVRLSELLEAFPVALLAREV